MVKSAIKYSVNFTSDFHIGSGTGVSGVVDDMLVKDARGRLIIPGKTLKGIIRDSCEDVVNFLGIQKSMCDGTVKKGRKEMCGVNYKGNTCLMCLIFGSEVIPSHLIFQSARKRNAVSKLIGDERMTFVRHALSRVETHNRIERDTGLALEKHLFAYELGKKSEVFEASIVQNRSFDSSELEKDAFALLVAGMRFVTSIGGKRRRGKGHCRLDIELAEGEYGKYEWESLIDHLSQLKNRLA